jgi:hypothetical protein
MTIIPTVPVNFGQYGNTGTIDISKFTRTGSPYTNPDNFALLLAQNMSAFDILFGDENTSNNSIFGESSNFGSTSSIYQSSAFGNAFSGAANMDITGVSPALEMIARSNLIGKTVEAVNPTTGKQFSGKVESVSVEGGILLINVGGTPVPPENLIKVTE